MQKSIREQFKERSGITNYTGLIGSPVSHSSSPVIHEFGFRELGMDGCAYLLFDVSEEYTPEAIHELKDLGFTGINVTMPGKSAAARTCDTLSDSARIMESVNVIKFEDGLIKGYNTDGSGFYRALEANGFEHPGKSMTLLGAGGAARALLTEGAASGLIRINVFNRPGENFDKVCELADKLMKANPGCDISVSDIDNSEILSESIRYSDLLVNATSVGMDGGACPLKDFGGFHSKLFVADIIYKNPKTALLKAAEEMGLKTMNGLPMLFYQADLSFKIWHGVNIPESVYYQI